MLPRISIPVIIQWLLFITVFMTPAVFRMREFGSESVDFQIIMKLGVWGCVFLFCLIYFQKWGRALFQVDNIALTALFGMMCVSVLYSPSFVYSAGAVLSVFSIIAVFFFAQRVLDEETILWTVLSAFTAVSVISIAVYFINPEFGRMSVWVNDKLMPGNRLAGITGTANAIGYLSAMALLIAFTLGYFYKTDKNRLLYAMAFINFVALIMCNSRTSMGALILSLGVVFFMRMASLRIVILAGGIALLALGLLVIDIDWLLGQISRSGDAEEILSGTGRSHIWPLVWDLIQQKPFFGWGFGSSSFVLPNYSEIIGHTPPHAHNALLQLWFSLGIFAVILYLAFFAMKLFYSLRFGDYAKLMMLAFLFLTSMTESSVWQGVAKNPAILLAVILCLPYHNFRRANDVGAASSKMQQTLA